MREKDSEREAKTIKLCKRNISHTETEKEREKTLKKFHIFFAQADWKLNWRNLSPNRRKTP